MSDSVAETRALGREVGKLLAERPALQETIALSGPLGSGKTCLVQGLGRALGITQPINSPSFVLVKYYRGHLTLAHWDWYRLTTTEDLESSGFGDPHTASGIVVIEWAEKFLDYLEQPFLHIEIAHLGPHSRRLLLRVHGRSARLRRLLGKLERWSKARRKND